MVTNWCVYVMMIFKNRIKFLKSKPQKNLIFHAKTGDDKPKPKLAKNYRTQTNQKLAIKPETRKPSGLC